jgi:UDP-glucose:(heptosyl)LPS alpha-1,3-glucosyltransferase
MKLALAHKRLDLAGGTERDFYRTAQALRDLGHEVHLFCAEIRTAPPAGVVAHRIFVPPLGRTARLLGFAFLGPKIIRRHGCDLVVGFGRMTSQDVLRSGGGSHRVFLDKMKVGENVLRRLWHNVSLYHRSVLAVERLQFQAGNYKRILAVSAEVKREIVTTYGVPEEKVCVIYNGVDDRRFHPRNREAARAAIKRQLGIPLDRSLALFVGSGFQRKGLERLLRVWGAGRLNDVCLLVVGDDAQIARYRLRAEREFGGRVVFAGPRENVEDYFAAADIFLLPAFQEAFGNVVLEALASGLPVLVSRQVGASEVLSGAMEECFLVSPDDPVAVESQIRALLDTGRWSDLSQRARTIGERYSWNNHFQELERRLLEVAEQKRRASKS